MDDVVEQGDAGEILDDAFVGDHGGVHFVLELVEDDAGAGEAARANGIHGEDDVIERSEFISCDDYNRQSKLCGEIGDVVARGKGDFPATGAFHDDLGVFPGEVVKSSDQLGGADGAVFQHGCDVGGDGGVEIDRVDFI